jgi:hypothetical protein
MNKILLLLAVFTAAAYGSGSDLRVIESTTQAITLEFVPGYDSVQSVVSGSQHYDLLTFRRSAVDESKTGMPDTRFRSVELALPGRDGAQVEVVNADFESIEGFNQAPIPKVGAPTEKNPSGAVYTPDFPATSGFYPSSSAMLTDFSPMHGAVVGYLKLYPLQYSPMTHTLKKCTRMVVRVTYGPRDPRFASSDAASWAPMMMNAAAAQAWYGQQAAIRLSKKPLINSVRGTGQWFKMEVADDGMVKIDASYLKAQGVDPSSLASIRDIKIYGGSGQQLSETLSSIVDADLSQCAVKYVDNNGNGKFDNDDYVLFFAQGSSGWVYNGGFSHYINPYETSNYYLMQIASGATVKEMPALAQPATAQTVVTSSTGMMFFDEDKFNFNQSGQIWVGPPMSDKFLTRVVTNKLTGYAPGTSITYRYDFYAQADANSDFVIQESDRLVGTVTMIPMTTDQINAADGNYAEESSGQFTLAAGLPDDRSTVKMTYEPTSNTSVGFINWLEILYQKQLTASGDELVFTSPDVTGSAEYPVSGFTTNTVLGFDVTDINNVKTLDLQLQQQMGSFTFRDNLQQGGVKKYWIGAASAFKSPKSTTKLPNSNLHGSVTGADFVIITHHDFVNEALRLKAHKESRDSLTTMVVDIDTVYNEFGNGMADPTAIRNFLYYAYQRWQKSPKYVLMFGDASFDYRGLAGTDRGWVPTYETLESNSRINSYCKDDYFVCLDTMDYSKVAIPIGRIAVRSVDEARFAVDRIIHYELNSAQDAWKNTITIVADDQWSGPTSVNETEHTEQAEKLAQDHTPPIFDIKKIYIANYATEFTPQGRRKPDARQAIIDQVNRGTLVMNFTGHGNPTVWAHESILTLEDTKTQFFNSDRLVFVVAATCDWGRFDQTSYQSSAEEMIKNQNGGAIGVLSAVRAVYSSDNAALNASFYDNAFPDDPFATAPRLGDALANAKNGPNPGGPDNKLKYHLLCDPTLRLVAPAKAMTVDSINGVATVSVQPDTLSALQKVTLKSNARKADGSFDQTMNGTALVTVYDAQQVKNLPDFPPSITYIQPGAVLYKGENSVVNGKVEATFIVPKDIAYQNKNGKVSVYFSSASGDGRGYTSNFVVGGTAHNAVNDTQGPALSIYFDSPSFKSGDVVGDEPKLIVAMSDSSGINSAGTGIGHRIEAWIDNSAKSIDLTDFYKSKRDSYQEGTVEYPLAKLSPGSHTIVVKAWDVYNNPASAEASFVVASSSSLSLANVYNIPNPASRATTFTFEHNQLSPLDVQIKIYSVAGRLIAQIDQYAIPDRFVQIPWDCRDNDGDPLGNGVYFYRIVAKTTDGKFSSEALGKLAVIR